jgi:hypothetical protein
LRTFGSGFAVLTEGPNFPRFSGCHANYANNA